MSQESTPERPSQREASMRELLTLTRRMPWSKQQEGSMSFTKVALAGVLGVALVGALGVGAATAAPAAGSCSGPTVTSKPFGTAFDLYAGKNLPVLQYTLKNCKNVTAEILTYGGITQSVTAPDSHGNVADVMLGFKTLNEYIAEASPPPPAAGGPHFGEIIGRYAHPIPNAPVQI